MDKSGSKVRYKLSQPVSAVKLQEQPGSTLKSPTETLVKIPTATLLQLDGTVGPSGLVNVVWQGETYSVFDEDLQASAEKIDVAD